MAIIEAIVAGERSPVRLAALCNQRVRSDQETVIKSLVGNYRSEHLFTLKQSLTAYKHYQELIADCDREIERLMRLLNGKIDPPPSSPATPPDPRFQKRSKNQFRFDMGSGAESSLWSRSNNHPRHQRPYRAHLAGRNRPRPQTFRQRCSFRQLACPVPCQQEKRRQGAVVQRRARPTAVPTMHCASQPKRWPAASLTWATSIAVCAPASADPRPSQPPPTNWRASSIT